MSLKPAPYNGLAPFDEEAGDLFCGREQDILAVKNGLLVNRLIILHGVAGVGITSFLKAGVARVMKQESLRNHERWGVPKLGVVFFPETEDVRGPLDDPLTHLAMSIQNQVPSPSVNGISYNKDESFRSYLEAIAQSG